MENPSHLEANTFTGQIEVGGLVKPNLGFSTSSLTAQYGCPDTKGAFVERESDFLHSSGHQVLHNLFPGLIVTQVSQHLACCSPSTSFFTPHHDAVRSVRLLFSVSIRISHADAAAERDPRRRAVSSSSCYRPNSADPSGTNSIALSNCVESVKLMFCFET